ncbi:hypothetical protein Geob_2985 [Geotalea daltonii FRC-32]|uniref:DUF3887 domain-containing protein n=1 Tax=Geotalea daltonii (strain DSM 22248 / JCM 15807 / FRC-32) TaxID=316067 RepID=B9M2Y2_GEODF|nr:hypothetical protein [Geotalea daltonii]ACM21328.1 hypothetical protein Geob_2985 [Geotalea daltonii FRC-32]
MRKIIFVLLWLIPQFSLAGELQTTKEAKELSENIVGYFIKADFKKGLELAKPFWPLPEVEIDGLANQIATQWPVVQQRFGKATGKEFVREESIGKSFVRYYYLHKFENHSLLWRFTFYKPLNTWKINGIQYIDDFDYLFESRN